MSMLLLKYLYLFFLVFALLILLYPQNNKSISPFSSILKNENKKNFLNQKSFSQPMLLHEKKNSNEIDNSKYKKKKM